MDKGIFDGGRLGSWRILREMPNLERCIGLGL